MKSPFEYSGGIMRAHRIALGLAMVAALGVAAAPPAHAQNQIQVLYSFGNQPSDGQTPRAGLWQAPGGIILYGTTNAGGSKACSCGTLFRVSPPAGGGGGAWKEVVLYSFEGEGQFDGSNPQVSPLRDTTGSFWGVTLAGGEFGHGTLFSYTPPSDADLVAHHFEGGEDGGAPSAALLLDKAGNLYGTTAGGNQAGDFGTVFRYTTKGREYSVLYNFKGGLAGDGNSPEGGLVQDAKGNLYGSTGGGGKKGGGTIFELTPAGKETVLYSFGGSDGASPTGTLVMDASNNLFGVTEFGGAANLGTVFKLAPPATKGAAWTETVLYSFKGAPTDGQVPLAGLVMDSNGNLYGTTEAGGSNLSYGTVFKLDTSGDETILFAFTNGKEGGSPASRLVLDSREKFLYGTASGGGDNLEGTVFRIPVP